MRFETESKRRSHPQAILIPGGILKAQFNDTLSEYQLTLMTTPLAALNPFIEDLKTYDTDSLNKLRSWLCIALSHPSASNDELIHLAQELRIPTAEQFSGAALTGRLEMVNQLKATLAPAEALNLITAHDYEAFRWAAQGGHLPVMEALIALAPDEMLSMIQARGYESFRLAIQCGYLPVLDRLMELAPTKVLNMIRSFGYAPFSWAAQAGHLPIMERLMALVPLEVPKMFSANDYTAFRWAAWGGQLAVIDHLVRLRPTEMPNMIRANNYGAFRLAAQGGHLSTMQRLFTFTPTESLFMMMANDNAAFRLAVQGRHLSVINWLLSFSSQIAYAEMHEREYRGFTHPFIKDKLASLRSQSVIEATPPIVFDVADPNEAKCCFYILRNLIRRNSPSVLNDIRFLLDIPAVRALAHVEVSEGKSNELVRLAVTTGNEAAAVVLLSIPAVRELAAMHNYYIDEIRGRLNLSGLALDRESSLHALSTDEQKRLVAVETHYQPTIQAAGVEHLFEHLLETLAARYQQHPSTILINGKEMVLPVDWESFSRLALTPEQRRDALKAYYKHKDHTALRYLSSPNHWMAKDASYVYINSEHTERTAVFDDYKPLIVMLWLAAQDVTIEPTDGYTLEGRVAHFIEELAQLGRAHNWDHSRQRVDSSGHTIIEEFDDLKGDKPSCFSGAKGRLFQSVVGHPLLNILTRKMVEFELRDFVRDHFAKHINDENRTALRNAWVSYCESLEFEDAAPLSVLNISTEQQTQFVQRLNIKYGLQFSEDAKFRSIISKALTLVDGTSQPLEGIHALKFAALGNLAHLLEATPPVVAAASVAAPASSIGFFAGAASRVVGAGPSKLWNSSLI